jgi:hypothetical protein
MTKARLIYLLLVVSLFAFYLGVAVKLGGMSDGGFW